MKKKALYSLIASILTSLLAVFVFYYLASIKNAGNAVPLYTSVDIAGGMIYVFILAMIVSASIWPGVIEKRIKIQAINK